MRRLWVAMWFPMALIVGLAGCSQSDDQKNIEYGNISVIGAAAVPTGSGVPVIGAGYVDAETADVPLEDSNGNPIRGISLDGEGNRVEDAVSVYASFDGEVTAQAGEAGITASKFLLVGQAAAAKADGEACAVSRGTRGNCVGPGNWVD